MQYRLPGRIREQFNVFADGEWFVKMMVSPAQGCPADPALQGLRRHLLRLFCYQRVTGSI